jgi:hypothetical protein
MALPGDNPNATTAAVEAEIKKMGPKDLAALPDLDGADLQLIGTLIQYFSFMDFIYCAVEDERRSLEQCSICERYCAKTGLRLVKVYRDAGKVRPSLIQMIEDARKGVFSHLVVTGIDRLGREWLTLLSRLELLSASGVMVTAVH